jgi:hypothetical protein
VIQCVVRTSAEWRSPVPSITSAFYGERAGLVPGKTFASKAIACVMVASDAPIRA